MYGAELGSTARPIRISASNARRFTLGYLRRSVRFAIGSRTRRFHQTKSPLGFITRSSLYTISGRKRSLVTFDGGRSRRAARSAPLHLAPKRFARGRRDPQRLHRGASRVAKGWIGQQLIEQCRLARTEKTGNNYDRNDIGKEVGHVELTSSDRHTAHRPRTSMVRARGRKARAERSASSFSPTTGSTNSSAEPQRSQIAKPTPRSCTGSSWAPLEWRQATKALSDSIRCTLPSDISLLSARYTVGGAAIGCGLTFAIRS